VEQSSGGDALKEVYHLVGMRGGTPGRPLAGTRAPPSAPPPAAGAPNAGPPTAHQASEAEFGGTSRAGGSRGAGDWTDELMQIVQEPMGHTFERMRNYSTSLSQVAQPLPAGDIVPADTHHGDSRMKETVSSAYSQSYKEEYSTQHPGAQ